MLIYGVKTNDDSTADANTIVQPEQQQQKQQLLLLYKQGYRKQTQHHWIGYQLHNISCKY